MTTSRWGRTSSPTTWHGPTNIPRSPKPSRSLGWPKSSGCPTPSSQGGRARSAGKRGGAPRRRDQLGRRGVYAQSWGTLEYVLRRSSPAARQCFALTAAEMGANLALSPPEGDYLTVAVRAASVAGHDRDISASELEGWLERIRAHFPAEPVWIVSDEAGTEAIRSWGLDFGLCYAQDFGRSFAT